jgi:alpha-beta hydrolase superfamily lysophospholipase
MEVADYANDITVAGEERPNGTVLVFSGMGDRPGVPAHVLDHFFAQLGLTAIYLNDFSRLLFLNGIKSLGSTLETSLVALSKKNASFGQDKPLFTFGNSGGGLGAIIYGVSLGAVSSIVFSPPATVNPKHHEIMGETRARIIVQRIMENLDIDAVDLLPFLERAHPDYLVTAYAGALSPFDKAHAELLATMPKTKIHLLEHYKSHNSFMRAANQFGLLNIMKECYRL